MEKPISLSEAFLRMLEAEDRALGVDRSSNSRRFFAPTDAQIANILYRLPEVTVYGERRRKMPGKVGDITHIPGGGSVEIVETDLPIEKPYQSSQALKLSEISEGKAHLKLIRLLQEGKLHAWGEVPMEAIGQDVSVQYHRTMIPNDIWIEERRVRKKGDDDPAMPAPIPNYSTSSMPPTINVQSKKTEEFRNIQVNLDQLKTYVKAPVPPIPMEGGVFRIVRKTRSKRVKSIQDLECLVEIKCADCEACLAPSLGLAAIGLLLGQPGEPMAWETLHTAAKLFRHGATREIVIEFRNQATDAVEWRPGNIADLDDAPNWLVEAAMYDDNLSTVPRRATSDTTLKDVQNMKRQLNALKVKADSYSGVRKTKMLAEIEGLERHVSKLRNGRRRTTGPDDGHRQAIYHELESALTLLALECPALSKHLGTLHNLERRAFQTEDGGIVYNPDLEVAWVTQPVHI